MGRKQRRQPHAPRRRGQVRERGRGSKRIRRGGRPCSIRGAGRLRRGDAFGQQEGEGRILSCRRRSRRGQGSSPTSVGLLRKCARERRAGRPPHPRLPCPGRIDRRLQVMPQGEKGEAKEMGVHVTLPHTIIQCPTPIRGRTRRKEEILYGGEDAIREQRDFPEELLL